VVIDMSEVNALFSKTFFSTLSQKKSWRTKKKEEKKEDLEKEIRRV